MTTPDRWTAKVTRRSFVATEPTTVIEVLRRIGLDEVDSVQAIVDGRVFVGRHRVTMHDHRIEVRDELTLHPPRDLIPLPDPFVLHHAGGILAVDKPAGLSTVPDLEGSAGTLIDLAARAIGLRAAELHATSRLDREVSGVVTFATDPTAQAILADARAASRYQRRYLALARASVVPRAASAEADQVRDHAHWTWSIARDRDPRRRRAVDPGTADAKPSSTRVRIVARSTQGDAHYALLALAPDTGRTHQLRVHAARAGLPLLGDELYGGPRRLTTSKGAVRTLSRVALHCAAVTIELTGPLTDGNPTDEPQNPCNIRVLSPVPPELIDLATLVGFSPDDFLEALSCPL